MTEPTTTTWKKPVDINNIDYCLHKDPSEDMATQKFHQFARSIASHIEVPLAFPFVGGLSCVAAAAQAHFHYNDDLIEGLSQPLSQFTLILMESGERKGPVFRILTQPLQEFERRLLLSDKPQQLIGDNLTAEALADCLMNSSHGFCIASEEGHDFLNIFLDGRYAKGSPQFENILKAYDGASLKINRATAKDNDPKSRFKYIEDPRLSIFLTAQPYLLPKIVRESTIKSGFLARFNILCLPPKCGKRVVNLTKNPTPKQEIEYYTRLSQWVQSFSSKPGDDPILLSPTPEAQSRIEKLLQEFEPTFLDENSDDILKATGNKIPGKMVRLASIIHLIEQYENGATMDNLETSISAATIEKAWRLSMYLLDGFRSIRNAYSPDARILSDFLDWLKARGLQNISSRDIMRESPIRRVLRRPGLTKAQRKANFDGLLTRAIEYNWLQKVGQTEYAVNPDI